MASPHPSSQGCDASVGNDTTGKEKAGVATMRTAASEAAADEAQAQSRARAALIADCLAVECELSSQHGGFGLRYAANATVPLSAGNIIGVYPKHAGMRPSAYHNTLPEMVAGAPRGEYAQELRLRTLYATRGRRSTGAANEAWWPNAAFHPLDMDIEGNDDPLTSFLVLVATRPILPKDFITVDYGTRYAAVREAKGYTVERLPGDPPKPHKFTPCDLEQAMHTAFSQDELLQLRVLAGIIDFDGAPGQRGDPNMYHGGPCNGNNIGKLVEPTLGALPLQAEQSS